jgi:diguanylate cyclase (GGDEF)-like protein
MALDSWDRRLNAAAERLVSPSIRRAAPDSLPPGLHPDDVAAAEALLRLASAKRRFAATLLVRRVDDPNEPYAQLRIENDESGPAAYLVEDAGLATLDDPVTQLPGRALLLDRIEQALATTARRGGNVAVLVVDIDGFRLINDAFGYAAGDEVLRWVATRLRATLRPTDTIARAQSDEFVVVAADVVQPIDALHLGDRLRAAISIEPGEIPPIAGLTVSLGVAVGSVPMTPGELLSNADTALVAAKARGRDRCQLFDDALRSRVERRITVDRQLRRALDADQLDVHFQPIVTTATGRPVGVEALVRITAVDAVDVQPIELIQAATDNGLLRRVETAVLETACRHMAEIDPGQHALSLSVNVTERQFRDLQLPMTVNRVLRESGLNPQRLCIEISEAAVSSDPDNARMVIARLRALGVRVAVDEFRGNHAILRLLPGLGIDRIKLDRSVVEAIATNWGRALVEASLHRASELGVDMIAVGVERESQLRALRELGCPHVQGYYFGRPVAAADLPNALAELGAPRPLRNA